MSCDQKTSLLLLARAVIPATISIHSAPSGKPTMAANIKHGLIHVSPLNSVVVIVTNILEIVSLYTMRLGSIRICLQFAGAHYFNFRPRKPDGPSLECGRAKGYTLARWTFFLATTMPGYLALLRNTDLSRVCHFAGPRVVPGWLTASAAAKAVVSIYIVHFLLVELFVWATPTHFEIRDVNDAWPSQPLLKTKGVPCDTNDEHSEEEVAEENAADQWQGDMPTTSCLYNSFQPVLLAMPLDKDVTRTLRTWHYIQHIASSSASATLPLRCGTPTSWPHTRCLLFKLIKTNQTVLSFLHIFLEAVLTIYLVYKTLHPCIQSTISQFLSPDTTPWPKLSTPITYAWRLLYGYVKALSIVKIAGAGYRMAGVNLDCPANGEQDSRWKRFVRRTALTDGPFRVVLFVCCIIWPEPLNVQMSAVLIWVGEGIVWWSFVYFAWKVGEGVAGPRLIAASGAVQAHGHEKKVQDVNMKGSSENTATQDEHVSPTSHGGNYALKADGYDAKSQTMALEIGQKDRLDDFLRESNLRWLAVSLPTSRATILAFAFTLRAAWYLSIEQEKL